ncbi:MAG: flagellar export protein FliJ [Bdellovibrio sp. CG10_big_fil_rev_8_21_14_0_10_47_8]|nr:MAG: flagellar export protein FliJ [Bdellovibrio sp. CG10_big_fil_rev_8_21_14_0_10_47_8]
MKFKFPLQKVLLHRKTLEDLAQRDFQEAMAVLNTEVAKLEKMRESIQTARESSFRRLSDGGKASPALDQAFDFIKGQDIRMERQGEKIKECESLVENLREILRQRAIDYKMIEKLKEKKMAEFKKEYRHKEQKNADELNVMRFVREDVES